MLSWLGMWVFFFKQKTAYEMRISDWSSDVCSSDLMEKAIPQKTFIGAPGADGNCNCNICPYMALNTMEKLYFALRDLEPRIEKIGRASCRARVCQYV